MLLLGLGPREARRACTTAGSCTIAMTCSRPPDQAYREAGVRVLCVKTGFVRTAMTDGLPVRPFAGEPEAVADAVVRAMDRGRHHVYAPACGGGSCW